MKRQFSAIALRAAVRRGGSLDGNTGATHLSLVSRSSYHSSMAKIRSRPAWDQTYNPTAPDRLIVEEAFLSS
jgi:hypothetical protein